MGLLRGGELGDFTLPRVHEASAYNGKTYQEFFGPAISPENNASRDGKYQEFTNNNSIYWHPRVSNGRANQIGGDIRRRWIESGYENGSLRYPTTRELRTRSSGHSGMTGRFNHFEGGSIYWSQRYGPNVVWGAIRDQWAAQDWEAGALGFPRGQEVSCSSGVYGSTYGGYAQRFEGSWVFHNTPGPQILPQDAVSTSPLDGSRRILLEGESKYENELIRAVDKWNEMGSVTLRPRRFGERRNLYALDTNADYPWLGYVQFTDPYSLLWFNDVRLDSQPSAIYYTAAHELGHALGLGHTCDGQLMGPTTPPNVNDAWVQFGELDHMSYRQQWGF